MNLKNKFVLAAAAAALLAAASFQFGSWRPWQVEPAVAPVSAPLTDNRTMGSGLDAGVPDHARLLSDPASDLVRESVIRDFNASDGATYSVTSVQAQLDGWARLMRSGDLKAARTIWRALNSCSAQSVSPFSRQSYEDWLRQVEARADHAGPEETRKARIEIAVRYAVCGNISQAQRDLALEALELLASSGDWEGRMAFINSGRPNVDQHALNERNRLLYEYRSRALGYLDEEIAKANVEALKLRANLHAPGTVTGPPPLLEPDKVKQLAYHLAAAGLLRQELAKSPPSSAEERAWKEAYLRQLEQEAAGISLSPQSPGREMSDEQIKAASRLSEEILKQCCGG